MIRLFIRHQVDNFDEWKHAYDVMVQERSGLSVFDDGVYQSVIDPDDVTVWHDFETLELAISFLASPIVERAMEAAGVTDEPVMWIVRSV